MKNNYDVLIVGGGASGFYAAIQIAEHLPKLKIAILEKAKEGLNKVKISGGGRCNITHAEFLPKALSENYPRGEKELLGPFHKYMTGDVFEWFESHGLPLKIEDDGRVFPISDSSQSVINVFLKQTSKHGVDCLYQQNVSEISRKEDKWFVQTKNAQYSATYLIIATGSSPAVWRMLQKDLDLSIVKPVPSLFTFHCSDARIADLPGLAAEVEVKVLHKDLKQNLSSEGPLLITHWGFSGPAILRLSAWGARILHDLDYKFNVAVNWWKLTKEQAVADLMELKIAEAKKNAQNTNLKDLPKRLSTKLYEAAGISSQIKWADLNKEQIENLAELLTNSVFEITGKSTFKDEFVTAGGVDLKQINFRSFCHKDLPNLYFTGEVLDIDAITGGFNFQNAWTSAYLAAQDIVNKQS